MARRTAKHFRDHLSVFEAGYPLQKGYIARRLLVDGCSVPDVVSEVQSIVQTAEPSKCLNEGSLTTTLYRFKKLMLFKKKSLTQEWPSLVRLFIESFPIAFMSLPVTPASQPGYTSPTQHPEPTCTPTSQTILEPDTPQTSTFTQLSASVNETSFTGFVRLTSPKKLKRDCANCVAKRREILNMVQEKKRLQQQIKELRVQQRKKQRPQFSLKRVNEKINRKTQSVNLWKVKFSTMKKKYQEAVTLLDCYKRMTQLKEKNGLSNYPVETSVARIGGYMRRTKVFIQNRKRRLAEMREKGEDLGPTRKSLKSNTMKSSSCKIRVVLDLSLDEYMAEKDVNSLSSQLQHSYSANRRAQNPLQLYLCSLGGKTKQRLDEIGDYKGWDVYLETESYEKVFPKESLVYLTSESQNILTTLSEDKVYIIGGLVDHNKHKGLCHKIAEERGIAHAQLPIAEYLDMKTRKVLAVNHVFSILLRYTETHDWKTAFLSEMPQRKQAHLKEENVEADSGQPDKTDGDNSRVSDNSADAEFSSQSYINKLDNVDVNGTHDEKLHSCSREENKSADNISCTEKQNSQENNTEKFSVKLESTFSVSTEDKTQNIEHINGGELTEQNNEHSEMTS